MRRKIATWFGVLAVGLGLAVAVGAPARASLSECPSTFVCIWTNTNFNGFLIGVHFEPGTCYTVWPENNQADSFYNHLTSKHVQFYEGVGCVGRLLKGVGLGSGPFAAGSADSFISSDRNVLSSIFFNTG